MSWTRDEMAAIAFWEEMRDRLRVCASSPLGRFPAGRLEFLEGTLPVGADCSGGDPAADHLACGPPWTSTTSG